MLSMRSIGEAVAQLAMRAGGLAEVGSVLTTAGTALAPLRHKARCATDVATANAMMSVM